MSSNLCLDGVGRFGNWPLLVELNGSCCHIKKMEDVQHFESWIFPLHLSVWFFLKRIVIQYQLDIWLTFLKSSMKFSRIFSCITITWYLTDISSLLYLLLQTSVTETSAPELAKLLYWLMMVGYSIRNIEVRFDMERVLGTPPKLAELPPGENV